MRFKEDAVPSSIQCVNELYDIFAVAPSIAEKLGSIGTRLIFIGEPLANKTATQADMLLILIFIPQFVYRYLGRYLDREVLLSHLRGCT